MFSRVRLWVSISLAGNTLALLALGAAWFLHGFALFMGVVHMMVRFGNEILKRHNLEPKFRHTMSDEHFRHAYQRILDQFDPFNIAITLAAALTLLSIGLHIAALIAIRPGRVSEKTQGTASTQ